MGIKDFERVCSRGSRIVELYRGTNTVPGGVIKVCEEKAATLVPLVNASAGALGPAADEAVAFYVAETLEDLDQAGELDSVGARIIHQR